MLEIGDGEAEFATLKDGAEVVMVHGPQNGWHILASVRLTNTADVIHVLYTIDTADGVRVSDNDYRVRLWDTGDCQGIYWDMYGYLDVSPLISGELDTPPELLAGQTLTMNLTITDLGGRTVTQSVPVVAVRDPVDEEDTGTE